MRSSIRLFARPIAAVAVLALARNIVAGGRPEYAQHHPEVRSGWLFSPSYTQEGITL